MRNEIAPRRTPSHPTRPRTLAQKAPHRRHTPKRLLTYTDEDIFGLPGTLDMAAGAAAPPQVDHQQPGRRHLDRVRHFGPPAARRPSGRPALAQHHEHGRGRGQRGTRGHDVPVTVTQTRGWCGACCWHRRTRARVVT